jgi:cytochrome o ubiquinol oxidase subunit 2
MKVRLIPKAVRAIAAVLPLITLGGCNAILLHPAGDVAVQQRDLLTMSAALMLLIIVPVMALTVLFAWRYRAGNTTARYEPDWSHSTQLELVIWAAPLAIVMCLGAMTWMGTHILDPYRQLGRLAAGHSVQAETRPLRVQVVALDWKWLFIYPDLGIATVNELAAPVDTPINFQITSSTVMNSFYVPALAGQIYAMPGMETKLHAVINKPGEYEGISANYSGAGFSGMHFRFHGLTDADFDTWVAKVRSDQTALSPEVYLSLEHPSEDVPVIHYGTVSPTLYHAVLNMCVDRGKMCMDEMMRIDAKGGLGMAGVNNTIPLQYDKYARRGTVIGPEPAYVASICALPEASPEAPVPAPGPRNTATLVGAGLVPPGLRHSPLLRTASAAPLQSIQ